MTEGRWQPNDEVIAAANLTAAMRECGFESYHEFYSWSADERAEFWDYTIGRLGILFTERYDEVLTGSPLRPEWLPNARLNIADSCFRADSDTTAVVYRRSGRLHRVPYGVLRSQVNRVANGMRSWGVAAGTPVAIAMPMTIEAVIAYLAIVLSGGVVVSIADSFAPAEISTRLRIADAEMIVTQDVVSRAGKTLPMYEKVITAGARRAIVVRTTPVLELRPGDAAWEDIVSDDDQFAAVPRRPGDHMNILFSSGTTGDPKAIPWTVAAPIKAASDGHYHQDIHAADVVAWPTNLGWMMGPWLIYATLINRGTIALYDEVPTEAGFARFVEEAGVTVLGVVPSLVAAWRSSQAAEGCDWSRIRLFSSTGEASNASDMGYLMDLAGNKPVIEYIGGTEIAGGYMSGTVVQPADPATFTTPTVGGRVHILDEQGRPTRVGELFIEPPTMGLSVELLNRDHYEVYYEGTPTIDGIRLRRHGDRIEMLAPGRYRAQGRVDDAMNLGGIKVSAAEIERVVIGTPGVVEVAAVAVSPAGGGPSSLVMFVVLTDDADRDEVARSMQLSIRNELNPLFKISDVVVVEQLPRTASAKVMRRTLRERYRAG